MAKRIDQEPGANQTKEDELQALIDARATLLRNADAVLALLHNKLARTKLLSQKDLLRAIEIAVRYTDFQGNPEERENYFFDINVVVCSTARDVANWTVWIEEQKGEEGKYVVCYTPKAAF